MLPNLYYRTTPAFELDFASKESFQRMSELMRALGNRKASPATPERWSPTPTPTTLRTPVRRRAVSAIA